MILSETFPKIFLVNNAILKKRDVQEGIRCIQMEEKNVIARNVNAIALVTENWGGNVCHEW